MITMNVDKICIRNYQRWKELALKANNLEKAKEYAEKAFFWIELQSSLMRINTVEQFAKDPVVKGKLLLARINLTKKLLDYANKVLKEFG